MIGNLLNLKKRKKIEALPYLMMFSKIRLMKDLKLKDIHK